MTPINRLPRITTDTNGHPIEINGLAVTERSTQRSKQLFISLRAVFAEGCGDVTGWELAGPYPPCVSDVYQVPRPGQLTPGRTIAARRSPSARAAFHFEPFPTVDADVWCGACQLCRGWRRGGVHAPLCR